MTKQDKNFRKGFKKGRYQPISKRKRAKQTNQYKKSINIFENNQLIKPRNFQKMICLKRNVNNDFFVNNIKAYKNHGRSQHFRGIEDILKLKDVDGLISCWKAGLVFSFITSEDFITKIEEACDKVVVVTDGFKDSKYIKKKKAYKKTILYYAQREFGANIPSSFHPKLLIIVNDKIMRLVIGSGNFFNEDWNMYSNVFWTIDLKRSASESTTKTDFSDSLENFCFGCLGDHWKDIKKYLNFCFESFDFRDDYYRLIYSLPTSFHTNKNELSNLPRIRQILTQTPPTIPYSLNKTTIIYYTSSIVTINLGFLYDFCSAVFGNSMPNWESVVSDKFQILNCFQVVYPTQDFVAGCFFGEASAKCLFLRQNEYERCNFEKSVLRKFEGNQRFLGSDQILPHVKAFVIMNNKVIDDDSTIYMGSHNFTKAAWGFNDYKTSKTKGFNYELGLIIFPQKGSKMAKCSLIDRIGINLNPKGYGKNDKPFFSDGEFGNGKE